MPGIVGILGPGVAPEHAALLQQLLSPMRQPGLYSVDTYVNETASAWLGRVRFESKISGEPVWNAGRDVACWMTGENDPAALVAAYEKQGRPALETLNGWFSGVLVDLRNRQTILFTDRYGLGRVYVREAGGRLFFSSEAKSLLATFPETRQLDARSLGEWFSCGCVLQNRTLFAGINILPAGACWTVSANGISKSSYFRPEQWESLPVLGRDDFQKQLQEVFPRALERSLGGSDPVGMSLTGGLDGRMIMAWSKRAPGQLPCYSFNGPIRDCADVTLARQIAKLCGQPHQTIQVGDEFFREFPRLAEQAVLASDGTMDVTGSVELYVNRLARQIAPLRLTGNYGSEIVRRNVVFRARPLSAEFFTPAVVEQGRVAVQTYEQEAQGNRLSFIAFKQVPWHHYSRLSVEQSQLTLRSPYLDNELVALAFQAGPESATALEPSLKLIAAGNPALGRLPTDRGVTYPPPSALVNKLRHTFHDTVAKAEYAYDYGMPPWAAKIDSALRPLHLERLFLGRQKFCHFRTWYRDALSGYVRETLLDSRQRLSSYWNTAKLEPLVKEHLEGRNNLTLEIHKMISLDLIHRRLLQAP